MLNDDPKLCPSSRPTMAGAVAFGVVGADQGRPVTSYLDRNTPAAQVAGDFKRLYGQKSVDVTEVVRFASPCAGSQCRHFDEGSCTLAVRIVQNLETVVDALPSCTIRGRCRWWQQEGKAACYRCPQIRTDDRNPSEMLRQVAQNGTPAVDQLPPR